MSTSILGTPDTDFDVDLDHGCPRCGGALSLGDEVGVWWADVECEECDYIEHHDERGTPRVVGFRDLFRSVLAEATWPYTGALGDLLFVATVAGLVIGAFAPFNGLYALVLLPGALAFWDASSPVPYCPECLRGVSPPGNAEERFCANCGTFYEEPTSYVDTDVEPVYAAWVEQVKAAFPQWISVSGMHLELRTEGGSAQIDTIIGPRRRAWLRLFDVGIVAFAAVYASALGAAAWIAYQFVTTPMGWDWSIPTSSSSSSASVPSVTVAMVLDFLSALAEFLIPLCIAMTAIILIHELGHGIAVRLHGHTVNEFGTSLLFGLLPTGGYTKPDYDLDETRGLRPALHIDTSGVMLNLVTLIPFVPFMLNGFWTPTTWIADGPVMATFGWFFLASWAGVLNAFPIGGTDGEHFQTHLVTWYSQRSGGFVSPEYAIVCAKMAVYGVLGVAIVGFLT